MRNTLILAAALALFGLGAVAQASDRSRAGDRDAPHMMGGASTDGRGDRDDRHERSGRRDRDDDAGNSRHESRERHDERHDEDREHRTR